MNHEEEQHLADLLQQATDSTTIINNYTKEQIHISRFRTALTKQWTSFVPDMNLYRPKNYTVRVQDEAVQQQLVDIVANALQEHTREGRIQTAAIATVGGFFPGYALVDLVERMVRVAIGKGPQSAAQAFYRELQDQAATYRWIGLLDGIRLDHPIEVRPGINIAPLPNDSGKLPPFFLQMKDMDPGDLLGLTVILIDLTISPIYADPDPMNSPLNHLFQHKQTGTDLPDFDMDQFCDALALACDGPVERIADWHLHNPDEIFLLDRPHAGGHRMYPNRQRQRRRVQATDEHVEEAVSIYEALNGLDEKTTQKLGVPIKRWIKSKTEQSLVDSFIDLGITLESLYLDSGTQELGFRLRLRAALFMEEDVEKRESLMKEVGHIYGLRSRAVHHGVIERNEETLISITKAQDLCRESIIKTIFHTKETGQLPNWSRMELGQLGEESTAESASENNIV